jgi:signal transduction histidine kinase
MMPSRNSLTSRLAIVSRAASGLLVLAGGAVLIGWTLGVQPLMRRLPTQTAMNPMTALAFVAAGVSLARLARVPGAREKPRDGVALALAALVALVGALKLADYLFGFGLHIDHLLFPKKLGTAGYSLSDMAPNTALNFLLCGLGLLFFKVKTRREFFPAQGFVLAAGLITLLALIGHSYRVLSLYRVGTTLPMSLAAALLFGVFCLGFLAAAPQRGLMNVVTSRLTGGAVARRLLPVAVIVPWILGGLLLLGEQAGYYGREFAVSIFAVLTIVIFTGLIWWNAKLLYLADAERTRAEERLRQTSANLERSNTDLEQFAYLASHDLFEPLRMVTSYLELLSDRCEGKLEPQARQFIGFALDGAQRMQALIHDLLEYSRVDSRGRAFEPANSEAVFETAVANLKVAIEESGATIHHGPLPEVLADKVQLTRVFQNLLGNSIKFRGSEPPRLDAGAERRNGDWVFFVRDNGIGIDPKDFDRIFVIFQRLHARREYPGTGLGLAIVKKIIERHGGRIWVESAPGKGATFFFTLPVMREASPQPDDSSLQITVGL